MPIHATYGVTKIPYLLFSIAELESMGKVFNPNMWIGDGFMYCAPCARYTYHFAMSTPSKKDCFEICKECKQYAVSQSIAKLNGLVTE